MSENEKTRDGSISARTQHIKKCDKCGRTFERISAFILHKQTHAGERPYHCKYCKIDFINLSRYKRHMSSEHGVWNQHVSTKDGNRTNKKPFQAISQQASDSGDSEGESKVATTRNICVKKSDFKKSDLKCPYCPSAYQRPGAFRSHLRLHKLQQRVHFNDLIDFSNTVDVDTSMQVNKETANKIQNNKKDQLKISKDRKQFSRSENVNISKENICDFGYSSKTSMEKLDDHLVSRQSIAKPVVYTCFRCKETFNNNAALECHPCKRKHQYFKSKPCFKYFKTSVGLKNHESLNHCSTKNVRVLYACPHCKRVFSFKSSRDRHIKTIHLSGKEHYICQFCKRSFTRKSTRDKHVDAIHKLHTSSINKPLKKTLPVSQQYICPFCKRGFGVKSSRDRHVKVIHQDLIKSVSLGALLNIRRGPDACELYKCSFCNKTFSEEHYRDRHIKKFHKNDDKKAAVYTCTQCKTTFSKEYMLRRHVMKVHWKEDNRLNRIKQTAEKETKMNNQIAVTTRANEFKICEYNDNRDSTAGKTGHKVHGNTEQFDKEAEININSGFENTDKCQIPDQPSVTIVQEITPNRKATRKKIKTINKEILLEYRVATENFEPCRLDPSTNRMVHVCKLCKTTYTKSANFVRHIQNNAYSHGTYLNLRAKPKNQNKTPANQLQKPKLNYRFVCDVCQNKFTRRFNMLSHRQTHSKEEFKTAGAREDVYKSPDGKTIMNLENCFEPVKTTEQEVSSTTAKLQINELSSEEESGRLAIYLDRADDSNFNKTGEVASTYPIATASLLFAETIFQQQKSNSNAKQNNKIMDKSQYVSTILENGNRSLSLKEQNIAFNLETSQRKPAMKFSNLEQNKAGEKTWNIKGDTYSERNGNDSTSHVACVQELIFNEVPHTISSMPAFQPNDVRDFRNESLTQNNNVPKRQQEKEQTEIQDIMPIITELRVTNQLESDCINIQNKSKNANLTFIQETNELPYSSGNISMVPIEKEQGDNTIAIPNTHSQSLDTCSPLMDPLISYDDKKLCITCGISLQNGHDILCCKLCDKNFCINCSDVPKHIYKSLFGTGTEWTSGVMWTCAICKHLVPKFTVLLSQLSDFEQIIDFRLTDMEQKLSKMGNNDSI